MNEWTGRMKDIFPCAFLFSWTFFFPKKINKVFSFLSLQACSILDFISLFLMAHAIYIYSSLRRPAVSCFFSVSGTFSKQWVFSLWDFCKNCLTAWILESPLFTKPELLHETVHKIQLHPQPSLAQSKSSKIPQFCGLLGAIFKLFLLASFFPSHLWTFTVPRFSLTCGFLLGFCHV